MAEQIKCPECGETFTCDPEGECWCKAYPAVDIPDALKGKGCLCKCVLERLLREQQAKAEQD